MKKATNVGNGEIKKGRFGENKMSKRCLIKFERAMTSLDKGQLCKTGDKERVYTEKDKLVYRYWRCPIVIFNRKTQSITIKNCGYYTSTTKKLINRLISPRYKIQQKKGDWYIHTPKKQDIPFKEQMSFKV